MDCIETCQAWTLRFSSFNSASCSLRGGWGLYPQTCSNPGLPPSPAAQVSTRPARRGAPLPSLVWTLRTGLVAAVRCCKGGRQEDETPDLRDSPQVSRPSKTQDSPEGLILLYRTWLKQIQAQALNMQLRHWRTLLTALLQADSIFFPNVTQFKVNRLNPRLLKSVPTDLPGSQMLPAIIWEKITGKCPRSEWTAIVLLFACRIYCYHLHFKSYHEVFAPKWLVLN